MQVLDWFVLTLYFVSLLGVAWWVIAQRQKDSADYFLAGRHAGWFIIGASLFASNIGSEHLVGLAGSGAEDGVAMAHYELHAWCLLVLGWVLAPFYARSMVFTMPEFLEKRYTPAARWFLSVVSLVAYIFTKIAVGLFAGGIVFQTLFPEPFIANIDNFWVGAVGVVIITGLYTALGGLRAVLYTEVIQTGVLIFGSLLVTIIGLWKLGSWDHLWEVCGEEKFNLWKPISDPKFPWAGMLFAAPIVGLWYWCTDQYIVQRTLAALDLKQARRGTIFASYLKLLPVFLFIVPGIICFALWKENKIEGLAKVDADTQMASIRVVDPTTGKEGTKPLPKAELEKMLTEKDPNLDHVVLQANQAFPLMVREILPLGVRGLVAAGLLAALMSSLASCFNSCSTLFTIDIYKKLHPQSTELHLVWVGRVTTLVMVVLGLLWIPFMKYISDQLYVYLQSVQAYIAPPIFTVFFLGVFIKRLNGVGCMAALIFGFIVGMLRLALDVYAGVDAASFAQWPQAIQAVQHLNFLYFCVVLFLACSVVMVLVSLATGRPPEEKVNGMTYFTLSSADRESDRASWNRWDVILSCGVLVLIVVVYCYFWPWLHHQLGIW